MDYDQRFLSRAMRTAESFRVHIIYFIKPFFVIRYAILGIMNITFLIRTIFILHSFLALIEFYSLLLLTAMGYALKAYYAYRYEMRPMHIDVGTTTQELSLHQGTHFVISECELWLYATEALLFSLIISFTRFGVGMNIGLFLLSVSFSLVINLFLPYRTLSLYSDESFISAVVSSVRYVWDVLQPK